jgi:hypothetical protein
MLTDSPKGVVVAVMGNGEPVYVWVRLLSAVVAVALVTVSAPPVPEAAE